MNNNGWDPRLTQEQIELANEREIYEPNGPEYEQFLSELGLTTVKWDPRLTQEQIEDAIERGIYEPKGPEYEQFLSQVVPQNIQSPTPKVNNINSATPEAEPAPTSEVVDPDLLFLSNNKIFHKSKETKDGYDVYDILPSINLEDIAPLLADKFCVCRYKGITIECYNCSTPAEIMEDYNKKFAIMYPDKVKTEEVVGPTEEDINFANNYDLRVRRLENVIDSFEQDTSKTFLRLKVRSAKTVDPLSVDDRDKLLEDLASLENIVFDAYKDKLKNDMEQMRSFRYAIDTSDYHKAIQLAEKAISSTNITDKMEYASDFKNIYVKAMNDLQRKKIMENGSIKLDNTKASAKYSEDLNSVLLEMDRLDVLAHQYKNQTNSEERKKIMDAINAKLKLINSTNRRIEKLKRKDGSIANHQKYVMSNFTKIKDFINAETLSYQTSGFSLVDKIENLRIAYQQNSLKNNMATRRAIRKAERQVYGFRLFGISKDDRKAMNAHLNARRKIINEMDKKQYTSEKEYRRDFTKYVKQLRKHDRKVIGIRNTRKLYQGLLGKKGSLAAGSTLTLAIPREILELGSDLGSVRLR